MDDREQPNHSELEVDQERLRHHHRISRKPVAAQSVDKEAAPDNGKELVDVRVADRVGDRVADRVGDRVADNDKELVDVRVGDRVADNVVELAAGTLPTRRSFWRKKRVIVTGIILLCVVIGAVVGGAVGGTQHKSTNGTVSSSNATSTSIASQTSSPTASPSPIVPRPNSNLAAVAWNVSDTLGQIRVYYQDDQGNIQEAARNTPDSTWKVNKLTACTVPAKNGTTIAAAFRPQSQSSQDSVGLTPSMVTPFALSNWKKSRKFTFTT
jgi:hypothetical protein